MNKHVIIALAASLLFACEEEETPTPKPPTNKYQSGVLISNEGVFQTGTGTLSFYNRDSKTIANDIFLEENGVPVGNILQSVAQVGNSVYLVVNNSQKIIVADAGSMIQKAVITGFQSPRYFHAVSADKAYVTDWVSNTVAVVNLKTNTITSTIAVGSGPENMAQIGSSVFVTNSGGFGIDSTITIINSITDEVEGTFVVGPNPNSIQIDVNGSIWILCAGISDFVNPANDVAGKLLQVDRTNFTVTQSLTFPTKTDHPAKLEMNEAGTVLYYLSSGYGGQVFSLSISSSALPTSAFINGSFYALGIDPLNDDIYTSDPLDYNQRGDVYRFSKTAQPLDTVKAGIIPGNFLFR